MSKLIDLTGKVFGRLTVIERGPMQGRKTRWYCRCSCESQTVTLVQGSNLQSKSITSCGCYRRERGLTFGLSRTTHGHSTGGSLTPTYTSWAMMIQRCTNPNATGYLHYGGRGIEVCERWLHSFEAFLADVGERPDNTTLDRVDVDGHYEPGNVRWATAKEQANNRRVRVKA